MKYLLISCGRVAILCVIIISPIIGIIVVESYDKWEAMGVVVNFLFACGVLWLSWLASREPISRWKGIKNINGGFIYKKGKGSFYFCLTNTGITPQKVYRMENDRGDILCSFLSSKDQGFSCDFDNGLKSTVVKTYEITLHKPKPKAIDIMNALVLQPAQTIVIPLDKYPSNRSTQDVLKKLSNAKLVFVFDDLGNKRKLLSHRKLKEVLRDYKSFLVEG